MFSPGNKIAAALADAPRDFRLVYSLRDIHRLSALSAEERARVGDEWHAWHRRHVALTRTGQATWIVAAAAAGLFLFRSGDVGGWLERVAGMSLPPLFFTVSGVILALALLVTLPALLSTLAASALCDAYLAGYSDGVSSGVTRALQITPDREAEMWGDLHRAQADAERSRHPRAAIT